MQYKCLKQADYGVHHGYAIAEGNNQYDNAVIIKRKDNGKIIACVENDVNRQLHDFIIQNEGKVHSLYFVLLSRETCERQYDFSKESNIITKR